MSAIHILGTEDLMNVAAIPAKKTVDIEWRGKTITVKNVITFQEYVRTMQKIRSDCTVDGAILYELLDFAVRSNILYSYAFVTLPKDGQQLYDVIYHTDLFENILDVVDKQQVEQIINAVYYYTGARLEGIYGNLHGTSKSS